MTVRLDELGMESALKDVSLRTMPAIVGPRIEAVQALHSCRQVAMRRRQEQVIVSRQEAERFAFPGVPLDHGREDGEKGLSIRVVDKDRSVRASSSRYVIPRAGH